MPLTYRVTKIEVPFHWLTAEDACYHFGEYTSGGGYGAGDTNRWIGNLKKKPTASPAELRWKSRAITYWANVLKKLLPPEQIAQNVTFVAIPGSKPPGHAEYDQRMQQVLEQWSHGTPGMDIRPVLTQTAVRSSQHEGSRQSPDEIQRSLSIDQARVASPLRPTVVLVDDVLTLGASFKAAQAMLAPLPGVQSIQGLFLARTVWPNPFEELMLPEDV